MTTETVFPIMFSGIRPGETSPVKDIIAAAGLSIQDLNAKKLGHFIVARQGDTIVGTVGVEPAGDDALLRSLAVVEAHRGQTIGAQLVAAIEKYARSLGVISLYLLTMEASEYFKKLGYQTLGRDTTPAEIQSTEEFRSLCPASAQCLYKSL